MRVFAVLAVALWAALPTVAGASEVTLRGFTAAASAQERKDEARFLAVPSAGGAVATSRVIDAQAHYPGTTGDYELAVYMRNRLRELGFDATLEVVRVRVDTPASLVLALQPQTGVGFGFDLREAPSPVDPDPGRPDAGRPFNYGSGDGDVVAPLVYANRGLDADYATLARANVNTRGAIVIVRYGAEYRGILALRAQANGAAGVIFYSDPKDDGYGRGPVYPDGPWRPIGSVQRGAVSRDVLNIPTLPITAANAKILLGAFSGPRAPNDWQGALPLTYRLGPSTVSAHLTVRMQRRVRELWNTVGVLRGSTNGPAVLLGGHRDAWVYGVTDNGSGISALLETARGLSALYRHGRKPLRTIIIAGWDGEEIGEVGSRAYVDAHSARLGRDAVAYLNADEITTGKTFNADAVAALGPELVAATHDVGDPGRNRSIFAGWRSHQPDTPSGGSDHESFLIGLGTPTMNVSFDGPFGTYHSAYDDIRYATTQADPGFVHHRAIAQLLGIVAMRLANGGAIPYAFNPYGVALSRGRHDVAALAQANRIALDTSPLQNAIARFARAAPHFDARIVTASPGLDARSIAAVRALDGVLYGTSGYGSVAFPAIASALHARNPSAAKAAVRSSVTTIDGATANLGK
jgi:N-acetylated-alpha-linked acidic dipeptidase